MAEAGEAGGVIATDRPNPRRPPINHDWKIRVQPAERTPFLFKATFVQTGSGGDEGALDVLYLYGDGDLAVLLQDLGAGVEEICGLLETLEQRKSAEIVVDVTEEAMEVLARRPGPQA
jgi:hypothetical protein